MKKIILIFFTFMGLGFVAQAQTITKQEAKEITIEINTSIDKLEKVVNGTDWKKIQRVVDQTAKDLDKNVDQVAEVIENIDFGRLIKVVKTVADEIDNNIDTKDLQKTVEEIGVKIDEVLTTQPKTTR